jgi:hypothetical protein
VSERDQAILVELDASFPAAKLKYSTLTGKILFTALVDGIPEIVGDCENGVSSLWPGYHLGPSTVAIWLELAKQYQELWHAPKPAPAPISAPASLAASESTDIALCPSPDEDLVRYNKELTQTVETLKCAVTCSAGAAISLAIVLALS